MGVNEDHAAKKDTTDTQDLASVFSNQTYPY